MYEIYIHANSYILIINTCQLILNCGNGTNGRNSGCCWNALNTSAVKVIEKHKNVYTGEHSPSFGGNFDA